MNPLYHAWRATFVRRWHSNPDMCHTDDPVSGHQQRVAILALRLKPDLSRDAVIEAITHDQGEIRSGDVPYDAKVELPALRSMIETAESMERKAQGWPAIALPAQERQMLKLCDWLDAYMWVLRHRPGLTHRKDWRDQYQTMIAQARELGVLEPVRAMLDEAERF